MICFLPCRKGSQRVPLKNTRAFAGIDGGLLEIKLNQLSKVKKIDEILVSSNDEIVLDFSLKFSRNCSRLRIDERPDHFCGNETSTDELIEYVASKFCNSKTDVLWTHVTSPFFTEEDYNLAIDKYFDVTSLGYDSLMTAEILREFIWNVDRPISYKESSLKWPRTQTLEPLYKINSAIFLASSEIYKIHKNRIGQKPYILENDKITSFDIDWNEDFIMAEQLFKLRRN